jgi:hypothetical protein
MPKTLRRCTLCGRCYPEGRDFHTLPLPDNSIAYICKECIPRVRDLENLLLRPPKTAKPDERRKHRRRSAHLLLTFTHVRGDVPSPGVVRDISQGGLRFVTNASVSPGELLNLDIFSPLTGLHIKAVARVKWVDAGRLNEVGMEFAAEGRHIRLDDRRQHHRLLAEFALRCRYGGREFEGRVKDISQGGIRFVSPEPLPKGKRISVSLDATAVDVVQADGDFKMSVEKTIMVVGVRQSEERYDIRAQFVAPSVRR